MGRRRHRLRAPAARSAWWDGTGAAGAGPRRGDRARDPYRRSKLMKERLDTARVFERIFAIYRLQARVLLPAAVLVYLIPSIAAGAGSIWILLAASFIATAYYQGVVVQAVRDIQDGVRDLRLGRLLRSVLPAFAQLLWTALLFGLGVGFGALLIIPGLILATYWAVSIPVVVCEVRTAPQALSRSWELVRGQGWRVFGVLIVTLLLYIVAGELLAAIADKISGGAIAMALGNLVASAVTAPLVALSSAVLYLELLQLKGEQLPPADMASFSDRR